MGDMLSQSEIDALLGGGGDSGSDNSDNSSNSTSDYSNDFHVSKPVEIDGVLDNEQKDVLGEIGNISMGTSATTLFALLNQKVLITTPTVKVVDWKSLADSYSRPCVGIKVDYTVGLKGSNVLVLKQHDVKIIADLMMGGSGEIDDDFELTELDLSAIAEAMNQMVGSSSTSLSSMLNHKIDIATPQAFELSFQDDDFFKGLGLDDNEPIVIISFRMEIGNLIDSEIMQIVPVDFAKEMVENLKDGIMGGTIKEAEAPAASPAPAPTPTPTPAPQPFQTPPPVQPQPQVQQPQPQQYYQQPMYDYGAQPTMMPQYQQQPVQNNVNVQPAQFQNFDIGAVMQQKENIDIIKEVPLEVTVELGRTNKLIKEILEFSPGTVIELDKLAGEPIDILVNGKFIAKGEVVVIDENFGIRITDIVNAEDRI